MSVLTNLAKRGYGWYLALKIGKALLLPFAVAGYPILLVIAIAYFMTKEAVGALVACIRGIPSDWDDLIASRRWFSGFSRSYYNGLHHLHDRKPYKTERVHD